eukprot:gene7813-15980_t
MSSATLCIKYRIGTCRFKVCRFTHQKCKDGDDCRIKNCKFGHSELWSRNFTDILSEGKEKSAENIQVDDNSSRKSSSESLGKSLCKFYRVGSCERSPCSHKHTSCLSKDNCRNLNCLFGHSQSWLPKLKGMAPANIMLTEPIIDGDFTATGQPLSLRDPESEKQGSDSDRDDDESDSRSTISDLSSISSINGACERNESCSDWDCRSNHPSSRKERFAKCMKECVDFDCKKLHPRDRCNVCRYGGKCFIQDCKYLHPIGVERCNKDCVDIACKKIHPLQRRRICEFGVQCFNTKCYALHPSNRPMVCPTSNCIRYACHLLHRKGRPNLCKSKQKCRNKDCVYLHPDEDCPFASLCENIINQKCEFRHPIITMCKFGIRCKNESCESNHPDGWDPLNDFPGMTLKSFNTRDEERRTTRVLPIFKCYEEFISRLQEHKVLIVTAATGSGKTTQLPQYAAEKFGGLVVCTQPRALAAITLADRIAKEFDDATVGYNVGYKVGGDRPKEGKQIMLMTDSSLVRMAQQDSLLSKVKVLIIDEAHERSFNTDLVLGIAKRIRTLRPNDFHVVIASATIDPEPFLNFFFGPISKTVNPAARQPLQVEGKMFPVELTDPIIPKDKFTNVIQELLIPAVVKSLKEFDEGHCLVFLPGSGEVDKAIRMFRSSVDFQENWEPLPLYGGMPPEEQAKIFDFTDDGMDGTPRMVVFCTNIAETSLTIPNVKLVVDTGLVKEARFDPQRRMTVLEEVLVCKSSADQRKGRSGRTAPGACVRLFDYDKLPRQNIEPELLRSSLDMVMLQLCLMGGDYHPERFSFIDRPDETNLQASLSLLRSLNCLDNNDKVTEKGKLFNDLPFDPRMSNFVMSMHESFGKLELGAEIAALLTAPGSIHFMGGSDKDAKKRKQDQLAEGSSAFDSDILHLHSTYIQWKSAGDNINDGRCNKPLCSRKVPSTGCSRCRTTLSRNEGLNNKICEFIRKTSEDVKKVFTTYAKDVHVSTVDNTEAIGRSLVGNFREQIGEILMPTVPDSGVFLVASGLKGLFSGQSCFLHNAKGSVRFLVSMSLTQTPSGKLMMNNCHPLQSNWMPAELLEEVAALALDMVECFGRNNINSRYRVDLQRYFDDRVASQKQLVSDTGSVQGAGGTNGATRRIAEEFVLASYDKRESVLRLHAPRGDAARIASIAHMVIDEKLRSDIEYESNIVVNGGNAVVTAIGGFMIDSVEQAGVQMRVRLNRLPLDQGITSTDKLMQWILKQANITKAEVKWICFRACNDPDQQQLTAGYGIVVLKGVEAAEKVFAMSGRLENTMGSTSGVSVTEQDFTQEEEWGRKVQICWQGDVSYQSLRQLLNFPEAAKSYKYESKQENPTLEIQFLPPMTTEQTILNHLPLPVHPTKISFQMIPNKHNLKNAYLEFQHEKNADFAVTCLTNSGLCQPLAGVPGVGRRGAVIKRRTKVQLSKIDMTFKNSGDASSMCQIMGSRINNGCKYCHGLASVDVAMAQLFSNLNDMISEIIQKFGVEASQPKLSKKTGKTTYTFTSSDPLKCGQAAQRLQIQTKPLFIKINERKQQLMMYELKASGTLAMWAQEGGLVEDTKAFIRKGKNAASFPQERLIQSMTVNGPAVNQGEFMAKIAAYSDRFDSRYCQYPLGSELVQFRTGHEGAKRLAVIDENLGSAGTVSVMYHLQMLEVILSVEAEDTARDIMDGLHSQISELLFSLGVSRQTLSRASSANECSYNCQGSSSFAFTICGHKTCKPCFSRNAQNATVFPICCPVVDCKLPIAIQDFKLNLELNVFETVCCNSALIFLRENKHHPLGCCPVSGCTGILAKQSRYSMCYLCNNTVCCTCGAKNDPLHVDINCKSYRRIKHSLQVFNADSLFQEAREFTRNNWIGSNDMGEVNRMEENPGIRLGCPSMQKYCKGIIEMGGLGAYKNNTFFAWHGTQTTEAVVGICHDGFDPKRRTGQAYGIGEYYGQSNEISHGYARGTGLMIVSQLLRAPCTSTHGTFCYVVNNPVDWKISYNLPVLVASYMNKGKTNDPPLPFKICAQEALPFLLEEEDDDDLIDDIDIDDVSEGCVVVVRWHWLADDRKFYPYNDEINALIESKYSELRFLEHSLQCFTTPEIIRFVDDRPQCYIINFAFMTQFNATTKYPRALQRQLPVKLKAALGNDRSIWEFYDAGKRWRPYDSYCQDLIESLYVSYTNDSSSAVVDELHFPGRPEGYSISFISPMKQTNLVTKKSRIIRRVSATDREIKSKHFGETVTLLIRPDETNTGYNAPIDLSEKGVIATQIRSFVKATVQDGLGKICDDWDLPILCFHESTIDLTLTGLTKSLSGLIVGKIRSILSLLYNLSAEIIIPSGSQSNNEMRTWLSDNPRLLQLATNKPPFTTRSPPLSRDEVVLLVAHTVVWQLGFKVYGGFVRDWVIRGEAANDIDSVTPTTVDLHDVGRQLGDILKPYGIVIVDERQNGAAWTIDFKKEGWSHDIKIVSLDMVHDNFKAQSPGSDCDCGNLCIDNTGQLVKKSNDAGGTLIPLVKCMRHCLKKKFVFFYSLVTNIDVIKRRLKKYFSRGWTCIGICASSPSDEKAKINFRNAVETKYQILIQLKPKYCQPWNNIMT